MVVRGWEEVEESNGDKTKDSIKRLSADLQQHPSLIAR